MAKDALYNHEILNPESKKSEPEYTQQKNGQLMGSIMSFLILCLANAAGSRWSAEIAENKPLSLNQFRGLINGDDVAIKSNKSCYKYWSEITSYLGLQESLGKTFVSREFVNINSTNFLYTEDTNQILYKNDDGSVKLRQCNYIPVTHVRLGLIRGLKRSQGIIGFKDQDDPRGNAASRCETLLEMCPEELKDKVYKSFIRYHYELLTKSRVPWYLPKWLGGIGLPIRKSIGAEPSDKDLRCAHLVLINWKTEHPIQIGLSDTNWKTRQVVQKLLPVPDDHSQANKSTEQYDLITGLKCIDMLFDSNQKLDHLYSEEIDETRPARAYKINAKLYSLNGKQLPAPLTLEELASRKKLPGYSIQYIAKDEKSQSKHKMSLLKQENNILNSHINYIKLYDMGPSDISLD
jgi:hypothetical protein